MRWKPWFAGSLSLIVFSACADSEKDTSVAGGTDGGTTKDSTGANSSDANVSEPTDSKTATTVGETSSGSPAGDAGDATNTSPAGDAGDATSTRAEDAAVCDLPESAPPSCEACLTDACQDEYLACHCNSRCAAELAAMRDCFNAKHSFDNPSDDVVADWFECEQVAASDNGDVSAQFDAVMSCALAAYIPPEENAEEDPYNRTAGDNMCTWACFEAFAIEL